MSHPYQFRLDIIKLVVEQDVGIREAKMPRSTFYYQQVKRDYTQAKETVLSLYHESKQRDGYRPLTLK